MLAGKVIPSPWGQQHAQDPGEGGVGTEATRSAWRRGGDRRVSGSESGGPRGLAEREDEAPCSGQHGPSRATPGARASRPMVGGTDSEPHRAPPTDSVLLLEEQSNPKHMTFHPPRVRKTVRAYTPQIPPPTPTGPQAHPEDTRPADNLSRGKSSYPFVTSQHSQILFSRKGK